MAYCIRPDANPCNTGKAACIILTKMLNCVMTLCIKECTDHYTEHLYMLSASLGGKKIKNTWGKASSCNISLHASKI